MASRQPGPGVEETPGGRSLPEPTAYADAVGRAEPSAAPPSRHRSPEDPPPRTPAVYAHTDHFRQRLHQQGRYVSVPIVAEAINRGQLRWNTTDGWRFALVKHGIRYVVVVGDTETQSPVVVTGWTAIDDWATARAAARWNETDLQTIRLRAALSGQPDTQIPDRIRPRAVDRAFEIGGHRIVTEAGERSVRCVDCESRFRSKNDLKRRHCRR